MKKINRLNYNPKVRTDISAKSDPNDGELYYGRGLARKRLQDRDGACEDWHKALDLGIFAASVLLKTCE